MADDDRPPASLTAEWTASLVSDFESQMQAYVQTMAVMDVAKVTKLKDVVYGRMLWKMDKKMKEQDVPAAEQRMLKKGIEKRVEEVVQRMISGHVDEEIPELQAEERNDQPQGERKEDCDATPFVQISRLATNKYKDVMRQAIGKDGVTEAELMRRHYAVMGKIIIEFRCQAQAIEQQLSHEMLQAFNLLKRENAEVSSDAQEAAASLQLIRNNFIATFVTDMTTYVNNLWEVDQSRVKEQRDILYGRMMEEMDTKFKKIEFKPADQKKLKKEIEQQVNEKSTELISRREQELQRMAMQMDETFVRYSARMRHEMVTKPFMSREECDEKHAWTRHEALAKWHDESSQPMLKERMEKGCESQWQELQKHNEARMERISKFAKKIINKYEQQMRQEYKKRWNNPNERHDQLLRAAMRTYKENEDVELVGKHIPSMEEGIVEQLNRSFQQIREEQS